MVKAVFFDLFETLITEYRADYKKGADIKLPFSKADFDAEWSVRRPKMDVGYYKDYFEAVKEILEVLKQPYDNTLMEALYQARVNAKKSCFQFIDPGVLDMLTAVKELGVKVGLISNCSLEDVIGWKDSCLAELFDDVVFSYEVGIPKPDPAIYLLACDRMGVKPNETVFIGDGGSDELIGAERAGMQAYYASWFIEKWPAWRNSEALKAKNSAFPKLEAMTELKEVILRNRINDKYVY